MTPCDICGSDNNVKSLKCGDRVCEVCVEPIRTTATTFGGVVVRVKRPND